MIRLAPSGWPWGTGRCIRHTFPAACPGQSVRADGLGASGLPVRCEDKISGLQVDKENSENPRALCEGEGYSPRHRILPPR